MANTILDFLGRHVAQLPEKAAIIFGGKSLTYSQLNERSNQLAHFLLRNGITPETPVPVMLSDPLETLVAILAILKAGGAYVPIDTAFPADRIAYLLEDTGARLIVSSEADFQNPIVENDAPRVIWVDREAPEILRESPQNLSSGPASDQLVYLIYTSGSTGRPKGVMIEHGSLVDYLEGLNEKVTLTSCTSFALGGTMATDLGNTVVFGSLYAGGTLHVFTKEAFNDTAYILPYFEQHEIDCLKIVPSHWRSLSYADRMLMPRKLLIFGGEALHREIIHEIYAKHASPCVIVNHYGPTETTIGKLLHVVKKEATYPAVVPIGKPFGNNIAYVLDAERQPVEQGTIGEIYISGNGVARGYLNKPDLTNERFLPDVSGQEFGRMYRTGDLGRLLPDGDIEFLGRQDDQVKINGYRIELGEIENTLKQYEGTKQCVVLAREDQAGNKRLVGYIVPEGPFNRQDTLAFLKHRLPSYMVPQLLVDINQIPFTLNGKIDKEKLPNPDASSLLNNGFIAPSLEIEKQLSTIWKTVLGVTRMGIQDNFFELGGNSLLAVKTTALMNQQLNQQLSVMKLYQYPTIQEVAAHLRGRDQIAEQQRRLRRPDTAKAKDVAVIGLAGRFPGADSIDELWALLKSGLESTHFFTDEELSSEIPEYHRNDPAYVKARGIINRAADFDAAFFGITPKLAELMDPQQRVFLEIAWEALEKSGHIPSKYQGLIGVYAGVRHNSYYANNVLTHRDLIEQTGRFMVVTVNDKDYVATRTAYSLDLKGPAVNVQSACSTSLLAIAQAVEGIRSGKCDVALAGGATITAPLNSGHIYEEGAMLSKDGHCRPFDADATGTVFSDGAGVVVLKDRELAEQDGDTIFAVIKGVGISNDGGYKGSFTAPSAEGQASAIRMAIDDAGIEPRTISYIETHGTATPLGDPIEIEGLKLAFGPQSDNQFCAIGSLKSNMGHLTCAAGVSGLIKAVLALHHRTLPPSINYSNPNPNIDFQNSPFIVNDQLRAWDYEGARRAGVSSFGVGGTNVHVVLEEYQNQPPSPPVGEQPQVALINWSAKSETAVDAYAQKLRDFLVNHPDVSIHDIGHTLRTTRADFNWRTSIAATDPADLLAQLESAGWQKANVKDTNPNIAFMFPGQGAQYVGMGYQLYQHEEVFRSAVDECAELLALDTGEDIRGVIYANSEDPAAADKLKNTFYTQPALFVTEYALAKLWMSWGLTPTAFIGHSVGEFVAAHLAGVFSLSDALKLVASRGRLISGLPTGSMLSVRASYDKIAPSIPGNISLAAINGPALCVVAGETEAISSYAEQLEREGIVSKPLHTSHAFHSHMMDPILEEFHGIVDSVTLNRPQQPIVSTVTGNWLTDDEATNPAYWVNHVRAAVKFSPALQFLFNALEPTLLEVGPGNVTATLAKQHGALFASKAINGLDASAYGAQEYRSVFAAIGRLWQNHLSVNWESVYPQYTPRRVADLPTYAFDHKTYWLAPKQLPIDSAILDNDVTGNPLTELIQESTGVDNTDNLAMRVRHLLEALSGFELESVSSRSNFIEIGFDSLLLTQIAQNVKKEFGIPVSFRQLNENYSTLDSLVAYISEQQPRVKPRVARTDSTAVPPITTNGLQDTLTALAKQVELLSRQLAQLQQEVPTKPSIIATHSMQALRSDAFTRPPLPNAKLGKDSKGNPAWFVQDEQNPNQYLQVMPN